MWMRAVGVGRLRMEAPCSATTSKMVGNYLLDKHRIELLTIVSHTLHLSASFSGASARTKQINRRVYSIEGENGNHQIFQKQ